MSQPTSTFSKFVGIGTLGLLTGSSLTLSLLATPALLALPSTQSASQALTKLSSSSRSLDSFLSNVSSLALLTAWILAPRGARHPYLLWATVPITCITGWQYFGARANHSHTPANTNNPTRAGGRQWGSSSEDEDGWRDVAEAQAAASEVNGESVRDSLLEFRKESLIKGGAYGLAFIVGLVGIWGDGF